MAAITSVISGRLGARFGSARVGAPGGLVFASSSLLFLTCLTDHPHYLAVYLPGQILGGTGVGLMLPALTALAASTLPPARLATGIAVQTTFRQIGTALGLASFVAIVGQTTLTTKTDFNGGWIFMATASITASAVLLPLLRQRGPRS
jgi:MFS family permease